ICPVKAEPIGKETVTYPMRPATEYAVSVNGTYIDCKTDFSGKYPMISAKSAFMALGANLAYETDKSICFSKDNKSYLFTVDDPFCLNAKKKIELRCAPKLSEGDILIPVSFLSKLTGVKAKVNGKDVEITHRIWK
ncbi:MAG: hypothetical protein IJN39_03525, partial [Clostridia bacterium]|nr:hypothetical protein [Clostridia bacterium]